MKDSIFTNEMIDNAIVIKNWNGYLGLNLISDLSKDLVTIIVNGIQVIQYRSITNAGFSYNTRNIVKPSGWKFDHMEDLPSSVKDQDALFLVIKFIAEEFGLTQDAQYLINKAKEDAEEAAWEAHQLKYPKYMSEGSSMNMGYYFDHAKRGDGFTLTCGRLMISNATKKSLQGVKKQLLGEGHTPEEISIY